jgi:hypothetical protein
MSDEPMPWPKLVSEDLLICNGCSVKLSPGEVMVCAACAAKLPQVPISYSTRPPRDLSHVVPGTCSCECHDTKILHFAPCCEQTYEPRAQLRQKPKLPASSVGDVSRFTFPVIRRAKVELIEGELKQVPPMDKPLLDNQTRAALAWEAAREPGPCDPYVDTRACSCCGVLRKDLDAGAKHDHGCMNVDDD